MLSCPDKGTSINNICSTIRIEGRFDLARIKEAINLVLMRDSTLRTRITAEGGVPLQYTVPFEEEQSPAFDFPLTGRRGVAHWEAAVTREAMELLDSPLYLLAIFRTGEEDGGILRQGASHHLGRLVANADEQPHCRGLFGAALGRAAGYLSLSVIRTSYRT